MSKSNTTNNITREKKDLLHNYTFIVSSYIFSTFFNLAIISILTNILGPTSYGKLTLFLMISNFAVFFLLNWPNVSLLCFGKESYIRDNNFGSIFWPRMFLWIMGMFISTALILTCSSFITSYIGWESSLLIYYILLFITLSSLYEIGTHLLQVTGKQKIAGLLPVVSKFSMFLSLLILLGLFRTISINHTIFSYILSLSVSLLFTLAFFNLRTIVPLHCNFYNIKRILLLTWAVPLGAVSAYVVNWIDLIVIKHYIGTTSVGIYSLAYNGFYLFNTLIILSINLTTAFIIILKAEKNIDLIKKYIDHFMPIMVLLWSLFLSLSALFAPELIPLIFGQKYYDAVFPFLILLVGIAHNSIGCLYSGVTSAYKLITQVTLFSVITVMLNLLGDFILIPLLGIAGAALSTSASFAIVNIFYIILINRTGFFGSSWKRYLILFSVLPYYFSLFIITGIPSLSLRILVMIAWFVIIYIIVKKIRLFKQDDIIILNKFNMPEALKNKIIIWYSFMSRG